MQNLVTKKTDQWVRVWHKEKFDDLANRDERFLSIVVKGALGWLTRNIVLYNRPIKHFIYNTGSSVMYMESNGYEYLESETTGEDWLYMTVPRCVCELGGISIQNDDLSSAYVRGTFERVSSLDGQIHGYNAEIRRIPLELSLKCEYVLSNFNESLILTEEIINNLVFQKYYKIVYLGQIIPCSIEFPSQQNISFEKIDMTQPNDRNKRIELELKICTAYPQINTRTSTDNANVINNAGHVIDIYDDISMDRSDEEKHKYN